MSSPKCPIMVSAKSVVNFIFDCLLLYKYTIINKCSIYYVTFPLMTHDPAIVIMYPHHHCKFYCIFMIMF